MRTSSWVAFAFVGPLALLAGGCGGGGSTGAAASAVNGKVVSVDGQAFDLGGIEVTCTNDGTLVTTTDLTPPTTWVNAPSQANPQTVNTTDQKRFYRVKQ